MDPNYKAHCSKCKPLRQAILMNRIGNCYFHNEARSHDPLIWHNGPGGLNYFYLVTMGERSYTAEDQATLRNLWRMATAEPPPDDTAPINKLPTAPPAEVAREADGRRVTDSWPIPSTATTGLFHYLPPGERFGLPTYPVFSRTHTFHYIGTLIMRDGSATHSHDIYYRQPGGSFMAALGSYGWRPDVGVSRRSWNEWNSAIEHTTDDNWGEMMREVMRWMLTEEGENVVCGRLEHQGICHVPLTNYSMER